MTATRSTSFAPYEILNQHYSHADKLVASFRVFGSKPAILLRNSIQAHEQLKQQQQPQEMQMTDNTPTTLDQADHNVGGDPAGQPEDATAPKELAQRLGEGEAEALISWMKDRAQSTPISEGGLSTDTEDVDTSSSNENETETKTLDARKSESS
ncbi:hypothetical protein MY4824_009604 [Beauveria thailandica]